MQLDHRLVVPPHSGGAGRLLESDELFEQHCSYWLERVKGGVQWVGGGPTFVRNPLIPGFEPTGVGSNGPGHFRHPKFAERMGEYFHRLHAAGGFGTGVEGGAVAFGCCSLDAGEVELGLGCQVKADKADQDDPSENAGSGDDDSPDAG